MTSGRVLKKEVYSEADKKYLVKEFTGTDGVKSLGTFIGVREDLGKLWKKRGWSAKGVEADGANDWAGSIEFKKAKSSDIGRGNTGKVIRNVKADIACILSADSRSNLRKFDAEVLRLMYRYEMLLDGNGFRGIEVRDFTFSVRSG